MASLLVALGLGLYIGWIDWLVLHLLAILLAFLFFYLLEKLSLSAAFFLALFYAFVLVWVHGLVRLFFAFDFPYLLCQHLLDHFLVFLRGRVVRVPGFRQHQRPHF